MKKIILLGLVLGLPVVALAADVWSILSVVNGILRVVMPILIAFAAVYFVWGVITFIMSKDEEQKKKSRSKIINGLIGLIVIVAFWGIIGVVVRTFDVDKGTGGVQVIPCIPSPTVTC